jgi:hypothetical protein
MKVLNKIVLCVLVSFLMFVGSPVMAEDSVGGEEFAQFEEFIHDTLPVEIKVNNNASIEKKLYQKIFQLDTDKKADINGAFFLNLGIDLITVLIIIFFIYYPNNKRQEYIFTFLLFNVIIFLLTYILNEIKMSMGAAFGLFAVFSMLRYRTQGISMKDMTYLFIFIALGLLSAINLEYYENIAINAIILVMTFILDSKLLFRKFNTKKISYDNTELIKPQNKEKLIEELKNRTGLNIYNVTIGRINFLKDSAKITVYYND